MDFRKINEQLEKFTMNEFAINEMAITLANSGQDWFPQERKPAVDIVQNCYDLYFQTENVQQNNLRKGYGVCDFNVSVNVPFKNNIPFDKPLTLVYGSDSLGVKHIFRQRGAEYDNPKKCKTKLNPQQIFDALCELDKAVKGKVWIDFDFKDGYNSIYGDRLIFEHKGLFYVILLEQFDGISDVTCLLTMFKPTNEYYNKIVKQNKIYKTQNFQI